MKMGKHLTGYDQDEIADNEVKFRMETQIEYGEEIPQLTEDEIRENVYHNSDTFEFAWEDLIEHLTEIMQRKNQSGYWKVTVNNFGWRSQDGYKYFYADTGIDLLRGILPDTDCTFKIYNYGKGIAIQNWHHDSPMGNEWYCITPCAYSTYEKNC